MDIFLTIFIIAGVMIWNVLKFVVIILAFGIPFALIVHALKG